MTCVAEKPLEIINPLQDQSIMVRQTATFVCEISKPDETATWLKNGAEIKAGGRFEIRVEGTKHTLVIKDGELSDQAEYTVTFAQLSSKAKLSLKGWQQTKLYATNYNSGSGQNFLSAMIL